MQFLITNKETILFALLAISEVIGLIPSVKSNSIFEMVVTVLNKLVPAKPSTALPVAPLV